LITGGSRGLGFAMARELLSRGANVSICARSKSELESARRALKRNSSRLSTLSCDVADQEQVEAMVEAASRRFGPIDLLINNASIMQVGPLESMRVSDFEHAMEVNFWGTVHATFAVLPSMRARRSGHIVNITSIGGVLSAPHLMPYSSAKFAVRGFSEGLQAEIAKDGVRVTTVIPGFMRTGSPLHALFRGKQAREFAWFSGAALTPLTSMNARRAARKVVRGIERDRRYLILGWQAKALRLISSLMPRLLQRGLALVARGLPRGTAAREAPGKAAASGGQLSSALSRVVSRSGRGLNQVAVVQAPSEPHA
jgi:short-subunit dehydrogenase